MSNNICFDNRSVATWPKKSGKIHLSPKTSVASRISSGDFFSNGTLRRYLGGSWYLVASSKLGKKNYN